MEKAGDGSSNSSASSTTPGFFPPTRPRIRRSISRRMPPTNGFEVIIAGAGKAAHLAGVMAAKSLLPVIGVPLNASLDGLDSLLATVQMPTGIPVATVAIDGAHNAALLAVAILAINDPDLAGKARWIPRQTSPRRPSPGRATALPIPFAPHE